jgi:hypothetical protein
VGSAVRFAYGVRSSATTWRVPPPSSGEARSFQIIAAAAAAVAAATKKKQSLKKLQLSKSPPIEVAAAGSGNFEGFC